MFSICFERIKLAQDMIIIDTEGVYNIDGNTSNPFTCVLLDTTIIDKSLTLNFLLMD